MTDIDLPPSIPDPAAVSTVVPSRRPMGTFVASTADLHQDGRYAWALRSPGSDVGWVTATDAQAGRGARMRRGRVGRTGKALATMALVFCVVAVPAWSVVANEFPESAAGAFAQWHVWIPFVAMSAVLAAWLVTLDWRQGPVPVIPGTGSPSVPDVAYLVTGHGLSVLVREGGRVRRRDVLRSSMTKVSTRDDDAGHVTVRVTTPDGDVVLPWIPRAPELLDTVAGWVDVAQTA